MAEPQPEGRLAENIVHFARVLRRAGMPAGPRQVIEAIDPQSPIRSGYRAMMKSREGAE